MGGESPASPEEKLEAAIAETVERESAEVRRQAAEGTWSPRELRERIKELEATVRSRLELEAELAVSEALAQGGEESLGEEVPQAVAEVAGAEESAAAAKVRRASQW